MRILILVLLVMFSCTHKPVQNKIDESQLSELVKKKLDAWQDELARDPWLEESLRVGGAGRLGQPHLLTSNTHAHIESIESQSQG